MELSQIQLNDIGRLLGEDIPEDVETEDFGRWLNSPAGSIILLHKLMSLCNHINHGDRVSYDYAKPGDEWRYFLNMMGAKGYPYVDVMVQAPTFPDVILKATLTYINPAR